MMSMLSTLALAGKAENIIPDSVLLEGTAPSIVTAEYDVLMCGLSMSTWVEFLAPSPTPNTKASKARAELTFDPLDMLPKGSSCQGFTPVSIRQRHGHSLVLAMGIHRMSGYDSESDASLEADSGDELCCSTKGVTGAKKVYADDDSQQSTLDALPSDQDRATTIESLTSYYQDSDVGMSGQQFSTKDSLPSLSGFADDEEDEEEKEGED